MSSPQDKPLRTSMDPQVAAGLYREQQVAKELLPYGVSGQFGKDYDITQVAKAAKAVPWVFTGETQQQYQLRMSQQQASRDYWTSMGYPEFAGVYGVPTLPTGAKITSAKLSPAGAGLDISYTEPSQPQGKGLAETIENWNLPHLNLAQNILGLFGIKPAPSSSVIVPSTLTQQTDISKHILASLIAPAEASFYSISDLLGIPWKHPAIPPTLLGAGISSGISTGLADLTGQKQDRFGLDLGEKVASALGVKPLPLQQRQGGIILSPETQALFGHSPEYAVGTLLGDYLLGLGISKVAQAVSPILSKIASPITSRISERLIEPTTERILAKYAEDPLGLSWLERQWLAHSGADLPSAIIGSPTLQEAPKSAAEEALVKGTLGLTKQDIQELPSLLAGEDILGLTSSKGVAGFGLTVPAGEQLAELTGRDTASGIAEGLDAVKGSLPFTVYRAGKQVSLAEQGALGFEKSPYSLGYSSKLGFEKRKLPSISDLLKSTSGETTLSKLIFEPTESMLPILTSLPAGALESGVSDILGIGGVSAFLLARARAQAETKQVQTGSVSKAILGEPLGRAALGQPSRLKRGQTIKQIPPVTLSERERESMALVPDVSTALGLKQATVQVQKQKQVQRVVTTTPTRNIPSVSSSIFYLPRMPKSDSSVAGAIFGVSGKLGKRKRLILTRIATPKQALKWSVSNVIFGKKHSQKRGKHRR